MWLKWNETRYLQVSAVTSDWFALAQGRSCVDVRRFFTSLRMVFTSSNSFTFFLLTSLNSLVTTPVTSSSVEAPHDSVSSTVDCASDSDDNRIIDRQITTARKAKLYDLDMLLNCSLTSTGHGSFWLYIWHTAEALRMACLQCRADVHRNRYAWLVHNAGRVANAISRWKTNFANASVNCSDILVMEIISVLILVSFFRNIIILYSSVSVSCNTSVNIKI